MDTSTSSHVESTRPKENARGENRQNIKANRRCDAAKGIHYGFVARLAGLKFPPANPKAAFVESSSAMRGLFANSGEPGDIAARPHRRVFFRPSSYTPKPNLFLSAFRFEHFTHSAARNSFAFHGIASEDDFGV